MYGLDSSKWLEEKQLSDIYAQARQRSYGDKYNQGDLKPKPTAEERKQKQDMRRGDYIDEGTLDPKGNPLKIIQDAGKTLIDVLKILPALGGVNQLQRASVDNPRMDIMLPFTPQYKNDEGYGEPQGTPEEIEELRRRGWANLQINPDIAGLLLPGETPAGGRGGLGSMNKDQLERWIKENGISGPAADKIRKKWGGLGPSLPLATVPSSITIRDYLKKSGAKGKNPWDDAGGSLQHLPIEERLKIMRGIPKV